MLTGLGSEIACRHWQQICLQDLTLDLLAGLGDGFACRSWRRVDLQYWGVSCDACHHPMGVGEGAEVAIVAISRRDGGARVAIGAISGKEARRQELHL